MKRTAAVLLAIWTLCSAAFAETAPGDAVRALQSASSIDEQLGLLRGIAAEHADLLENGGWDLALTCEPAQPLPEDLLPAEDMEEAELSVSDFADAKFIAIYDDQGDFRLLGDFQVRLPEEMRAASLAEADAVLCLTHTTHSRDDYIGSAFNRNYYAYVYRRGSNVRTTAYHVLTTPPVSGYGILGGEHLSFSELWNGVRQWFYGVVELSYPQGTAVYRITGRSCCLAALEGDFTFYEIPREVNGLSVTGIERCKNDTLEELVLPEGVVWIRYVGGKNLRRMNFPATLRRIEDYVCDTLDEVILNEGLEQIADFSLLRGCGEAFALPSTLKSIGKGTLEYGAGCPYLIVPEGVQRLPDYFLSSKGRALCVFVPESVTSVSGNDLFEYGNVLICTPEGSAAARWAEARGYEWMPCARAEDMPRPVYQTQDGFEFAILRGEAILSGYTGNDACVRVPDTLGGCPVAVVRSDTFSRLDSLRAVLFPDTVRKLEHTVVRECKALEAAFIPASVTDFHAQAVFSSGEAVCYAPEGSAAWDKLENYSSAHAAWIPGAEDAWFPEKAAQ